MKLQYKNIIYDVTDKVVIERLLSDGFYEVGTKEPEKAKKVIEVDENTGNKIEKPEKTVERKSLIDFKSMMKAEIMELLDDKGIKYPGSATKETLIKIATDNKLGEE